MLDSTREKIRQKYTQAEMENLIAQIAVTNRSE
jgi:hypothetical protein